MAELYEILSTSTISAPPDCSSADKQASVSFCPTQDIFFNLSDLVIQFAADELLVFDHRTHKAYVLNPTAAAVWHASNGTRTVPEIATYLSGETPTTKKQSGMRSGNCKTS